MLEKTLELNIIKQPKGDLKYLFINHLNSKAPLDELVALICNKLAFPGLVSTNFLVTSDKGFRDCFEHDDSGQE